MTPDEFRRALQEITSPNTLVDDQWRKIEDLRGQYAHTIVRLTPSTEQPFNCFMYALGLDSSRVHLEINNSSEPPIFASACFIFFLLSHKVLTEKDMLYRTTGDILLYYSGDLAIHAARVTQAERAASKWGTGLLLEHKLLDTPANYESHILCFGAISPAVAETEFVKYAACMGHIAG